MNDYYPSQFRRFVAAVIMILFATDVLCFVLWLLSMLGGRA